MPDPLMETKLLLPRVRPDAVPRPRLDELVARGARASLTLVSAPAGFGKTSLLAAWLAGAAEGRATAWVSLDERDRQPTSFWTYVLLGLERAAPGAASAALALLQSGQAPIEAVLTVLLNELSVLDDDLHLVLDDFHLVDGPDVQPGMAFLVEHLPPQLHVVISTRADPALPLARLRARGELVEVRAADLRFTSAEATSYLNGGIGLALDPAEIDALEGRTEGWIAALQLAALSLQGRDDAAGFIAGFAGNDRYVVDYLAEEVLSRQPDEVRRFLLDTSVLENLTGPLCDAVTASAGGQTMLEDLDRKNLFVVPLDDRRGRYRYHHLFGDVLRAHVLEERPGDVPLLHRRASQWYDESGEAVPAVRHALAAGDVDRAADLVELAIPDLRRERREAVLRGWMDDLPAEVVANRPVLAVGFIGAMMASNEFEGIAPRLDAVEELLATSPDQLVVVDLKELPRLPGAMQTYRAALALSAGDPLGTIEHAELALARAIEDDHLTIAAASALAGLASWSTGDILAARDAYAAAVEGLTRAGHIADVLGCSLAVADMELALGRLSGAARALESALDLADRHRPSDSNAMRGTADMLVALSRTAWHRNDLRAAAEYLGRADELGDSAGLPQNPYRWRVAMARLRAAERDWGGAIELLDQAERVYVGDFSPPVHPIHATRARMLAASGDVTGARAWAREHDLSTDDHLSYLREYEHVTLARVLLAEHRTGSAEALGDATALLDRILVEAAAGGRTGTVIEVEALRAVAHQRAGDQDAAEAALEHAVELAEPEGWVRVLVDAGPEVAGLLETRSERRPSGYLRDVLAAATPPAGAPPDPATDAEPGGAGQPAVERLIDPLSDRELDVLRLLGSDLDGPGIARELVVSLNTIRTHTKHIYTKLGVNSRRAAVRRGHQLNLLAGRR